MKHKHDIDRNQQTFTSRGKNPGRLITHLCFIFDKDEKHTFKSKSVQTIMSRLHKGIELSFCTNHFHNIRFNLKYEGRVNWPINSATIWGANELIAKDLVDSIDVIPLSKREYRFMLKTC